MPSAFVLPFFTTMLVGGLCRVMPDWLHSPLHVMRRQESSCQECFELAPISVLDNFTSVADGKVACETDILRYVDCIKGDNGCSHLAYAADLYDSICSEIEGTVALSQCLGGDAGFHKVLQDCESAKDTPAKQGPDSDSCGGYSAYMGCVVDEGHRCSASAGQVLNSLFDNFLELHGCAQ